MVGLADELKPLATLRGVAKRYDGVQALADVDLDIYAGSIHAIVGENGAGKSTLMKIVAGVETADRGTFEWAGRPASHRGARSANDVGIAIVFQELSLFPDLDILANLFLLREPLKAGLVDRAKMASVARPILEMIGLDVDPSATIKSLRLAEQQLVEIAKALLADARLLILDEPNSALSARESERLFEIVRGLSRRGVAVLFISHRLEEVFALCDRITVLRNGRTVRDAAVSNTSVAAVVAGMLGPAGPSVERARSTHRRDGPALTLDRVTLAGAFADVSFSVCPGEVVGLAGLEGSGANAIFDVLFGLRTATRGMILLPGGRPAPASPQDAVSRGVALVPADRRVEGLALEQDITENMVQVTVGALGRFGAWLRRSELDRRSTGRADALRLNRRDPRQAAGSLSGGNQQKLVLGKWLEAEPQIILLNDPTRGVDVGAKAEIYRIIEQQAEAGRILIFHSTELSEFEHVCDRVLVFRHGRIGEELAGDAVDEHRLLHAINFGASSAASMAASRDSDAAAVPHDIGATQDSRGAARNDGRGTRR
jgi:ABC-type sugar transport system ATPase subunit